jgi:lipopolysaccharide/colanic/teichoic acid biosynthesis glycosyltransferase
VVAAIVLAPIAAVVAVLIKSTSAGPVLFRQERVGLHGSRFVMYKFRTMYHGADEAVHQTYFEKYRRGVAAPDQDGKRYKLQRDPRITPLGGMLRRLALDEIPQLINVLQGDMSLVGPRPAIPYEVDLYSQNDLMRLHAKPGMTGLWQVRGRDTVDFATMVALDLDYIRRRSLPLDLWIMLATIPALIWGYVKH